MPEHLEGDRPPPAADGWVTSTLPQGIVKALDEPKTVRQLSIELGVTDARVL